VQSDSKIVVVGTANKDVSEDFVLARYVSTGVLDATFGTNGKVTTTFGPGPDVAYAVVIQPDTKIVVAGSATGTVTDLDFAMARYDSLGIPDPNFGFGGIVTTDFGTGKDEVYGLALQADGKILLSGEATVLGDESFAVARYDTTGVLDPTFGTGGTVFTDFSGENDDAYGLAIQADDKIVAGGSASVTANVRFAMSRYIITSAPSAGFADDFEDGILATNWAFPKGNWQETGGSLVGSTTRKAIALTQPPFAGCSLCGVTSTLQTAGGTGNKVELLGWYTDKDNMLEVMMKEEADRWLVKQHSDGIVVAKAKASLPISPNVSYKVFVDFDGTNFLVYVDDVLIITLPKGAGTTPDGRVGFQVKNTTGTFDFITVQ
jgi:uncharacterized delta-60 repeat protein